MATKTRSQRTVRIRRQAVEPASALAADAAATARAAGMRYVSDNLPGIRRMRAGRGFRYVSPAGKTIRNRDTLSRIRSLAIPPAWTDVWICLDPQGHLQATGRDARGRKQFRYHPQFRLVRDANKFERMVAFGKMLPRLRSRIRRDLKLPGMPREKVLATIIRLLETTFIRIGNEEYARQNGSIGLTTMRNRHVAIRGARLRFQFRGKSGIAHCVEIEDPKLARIIRRCQELPGQDLFQYFDEDGTVRDVGSSDVNDYLRSVTGEDFTAKDFRTWAGTLLAAASLLATPPHQSMAEAKRNVVACVEVVAKRLGNTKTVCRKCYIHPSLIETYLEGTLVTALKAASRTTARTRVRGLRQEEAAVLAFLRRVQRQAITYDGRAVR